MPNLWADPSWWDPPAIWPRRLLHIQTMTSLERQKGNIYGDQKEPQYSILTYTWGRWQTDRVPAIEIKGTTWKIPAVEEKHFTVANFHRVTQQMGKQTEYAWIDVACIDQENRAVKMEEVGRQVGIFKQAHRVFVWLNGLEPSDLEHCLNEIFVKSPKLGSAQLADDISKHLQSLTKTMETLFSDPWFSSLWTLQESVLRRDAIILNRDGEPVPLRYTKGEALLAILANSCVNVYSDLSRICGECESHSEPSIRLTAEKLQAIIEAAGLHFLYSSNPNIQYGVAHFRKTSYPLDRMYGIMQIYGLQLGESRQANEKPTVEQLEEEFAKELILRWPVLSQMFTHRTAPPRGKNWRITQNSRVPDEVKVYRQPSVLGFHATPSHGWPPASEIPLCHISVDLSGQVNIKGKSWLFRDLVKYWRGDRWFNSRQNIMLDESDQIRERIPTRLAQFNLRPDDRQHELGNYLVDLFGESNLVWFLVGESREGNTLVGFWA
ncbi:hypothetical protein DL768_008329 [Monosporascus sp. mg162]|nr:hypothetical protein DL768_008329 [Monosporascus sp. mg162]